MFGLIPYSKTGRKDLDSFYDMFDDILNEGLQVCNHKVGNFKLDIRENEKDYIVDCELPGINKSDIQLEYDEDKLTINVVHKEEKEKKEENYLHRERRVESMSRTIVLKEIDREKITASFENGILNINVPKAEVKSTKKSIDIN